MDLLLSPPLRDRAAVYDWLSARRDARIADGWPAGEAYGAWAAETGAVRHCPGPGRLRDDGAGNLAVVAE